MKRLVHRLRAIASISLLPIELFRDWIHCVRWGKGSPFSKTQDSLYYDIVLLAHTVEKGLSLLETRPSFGVQKITTLLEMCEHYDWNRSLFPIEMTYGALKEYSEYHQEKNIELGQFGTRISKFLERAKDEGIEPKGGTASPDFSVDRLNSSEFLSSRWSCRNFEQSTVPAEDVQKIVKCAQSAPSQCNRQSVRVHAFQSKQQIQALLRLQGGTTGFTDLVSNLFVITSESFAWSGAKPRNQAYVDGGIFAMQLGMSCIAHSYGCCFLNLAVTNGLEKQIKEAGGISQGEKLVVMMAFGSPITSPNGAARSARLPVNEVLTFHSCAE
ncbi:nitroreductase family protein [Neorhodopirellula lusitana]|uniref:nitroreductase family protein n=1 Tax=Neorhodopirellula lusitana TaxID=445327 RepID=UPI00384DBF41